MIFKVDWDDIKLSDLGIESVRGAEVQCSYSSEYSMVEL